MKNNLKLLALSNDFTVIEEKDGAYYTITSLDGSHLSARIYPDKNEIEYGVMVMDIYYEEFVEIDVDTLNKLKNFCELLMNDNK